MNYAVKTGTVTGTGAAINVSLGFQPDYVKVFNIGDAGGLDATLEWVAGMASGGGVKTLRVVDSGTTGNASSDYITTGGISLYAGDQNNAEGFTIGTDPDINASGETIVWVAMRTK